MNKKFTFKKRQEFPTMIGEISAISLEHDFNFIDNCNISGNLILTGKYKLTEASRLEEDFNYLFPVEIALSNKLDLESATVNITDFNYEIENSDTIVCHIELEIIAEELIEERLEKENRECDGDIIKENTNIIAEDEIPDIKEEHIPIEKEIIEIDDKKEKKEINTEKIIKEEEKKSKDELEDSNSFFINLTDDKDTFGTFIVYIVRQNENLNTIIEKYHTTIEELEKYNSMNEIGVGTKLIIPYKND